MASVFVSLGLLALAGILTGLAILWVQGLLNSAERSTPGKDRVLNPIQELSPAELGDYPVQLSKEPRSVILGERARLQHTQIIGSSGTGKTYHAILPMACQDIRHHVGVINIDSKSNMRVRIASYAQSAGRSGEFHHLDLDDPSHSMSYNPLVGEDPAEIANRVWTAFFQDDQTATPFYRESALSYCRLFFGICKHLGVLATLAQLQTCVADQEYLEALILQASGSEEAKLFKKRYLDMPQKEYFQTFTGFMNKLAPLAGGPFAKLLNTHCPQIDMRRIVEDGQILTVGLAADRYPFDYKTVSTLVLMDLQSNLSYRFGPQSKKPLFLYMDEFGDLVYPKARDLIAKAREARVGVILAHQAMGDLQAHGKAFADSIFTSTSNKIIFRVGSADTAEQLAKLSGTTPVRHASLSHSVDALGFKTPQSASESSKEEFLFHPNDLMNLGIGEAMILVQRKDGRELHHSRMLDAPELPSWETRGPSKKSEAGVEYKALELEHKPSPREAPHKPKKSAARQAVLDVLSGKKRGATSPE